MKRRVLISVLVATAACSSAFEPHQYLSNHTRFDAPSDDRYIAARLRILESTRADYSSLQQPAERTVTWGVAMETGSPYGNQAFLFLSNGRTFFLDASGRDRLRGFPAATAIQIVTFADSFEPHTTAAVASPLDGRDRVTFYLLSDMGPRSSSVDRSLLETGRHPLSPLFCAIQAVIPTTGFDV